MAEQSHQNLSTFHDRNISETVIDKSENNISVIDKRVQEVEREVFMQLEPNDILFIDSSHVVKTGSDVNFLLFKILPILKPGVLIHFHDIHYPFEYPQSWVLNGFGWNETYFIKAFMMYNSKFEVLFFTDYLEKEHSIHFKLPKKRTGSGSSFWIKRKEND